MSLRSLAVPALFSLVAATACAKRNAADASIGAPEQAGPASVSGPANAGGMAPTTMDSLASRDGNESADASVRGEAAPMDRRSPGLGTAYGEQRFSSVRSAQFRRAQASSPDVLLSLRYDDAAGVDRMAHWKTGQRPQRANHSAGLLGLTLRDDAGNPLPGAQIGSDIYAVGEAGARYTIGVENHSAQRYEVLASVDGLDVIDGGEADFSKRGYLIDPYTSFVIEGWRTGDDTVASFRFSDMDDSYAGRTGKPRNIGVIGLAFFREEGQPPHDELRRRDQADPFPNRYAPPPPGYRADGY